MSVAPITLPPELNPNVQEIGIEHNPAVQQASIQNNTTVQEVASQNDPAVQVLSTLNNPATQEVAAQNNAAVQGVNAQAPSALPPTQANHSVFQNAQGAVQPPRANEVSQLFSAGESVSQIASETGLSPTQVDLELGITTPSTNFPAAPPLNASETASTAAAVAVANYSTVSETKEPTITQQADVAEPRPTISVTI